MSICDLPLELLLPISSYLTTPELGCLRRTCKYVEEALFDSFANEFFTKRQFMIEHVSLQALVDIANHPTLSRRLSEVIISLHMFSEESVSAVHACYHDHVPRATLLDTGLACDMLVDAFSKLPNLRTVGLRDYNARGRHRDGDGLDAMWRSYGWSYATKPHPDGHAQPAPPTKRMATDTTLDSPETTFALIMYALGCAQARPQSVQVFLRRRKLTPASLNVVNGLMAARVVPVLTALKTLMLHIGLEYVQHSDKFGAPWRPYNSSDNDTVAPLQHLLHRTPDLETLRLNFDHRQFFALRFLDWLAKPVPTTPLPQSFMTPVSLPNLTSLELGQLNVTNSTLLSALAKFPTLRSLSLWKITLHCTDLYNEMEKPDRWALFLEDFSAALPVSSPLDSVLIGWVYQGSYISNREPYPAAIRFRSNDVNAEAHVNADSDRDHDNQNLLSETVTYCASRGPITMTEWLRELSGRTSFEQDLWDPEADSEDDGSSAESADTETLEEMEDDGTDTDALEDTDDDMET